MEIHEEEVKSLFVILVTVVLTIAIYKRHRSCKWEKPQGYRVCCCLSICSRRDKLLIKYTASVQVSISLVVNWLKKLFPWYNIVIKLGLCQVTDYQHIVKSHMRTHAHGRTHTHTVIYTAFPSTLFSHQHSPSRLLTSHPVNFSIQHVHTWVHARYAMSG